MTDNQAAEDAGFDLTNEEYREYVYADGSTYRISDPRRLYIVNGSHRVVDSFYRTNRPERGYLAIRWVQRDGKPFSF